MMDTQLCHFDVMSNHQKADGIGHLPIPMMKPMPLGLQFRRTIFVSQSMQYPCHHTPVRSCQGHGTTLGTPNWIKCPSSLVENDPSCFRSQTGLLFLAIHTTFKQRLRSKSRQICDVHSVHTMWSVYFLHYQWRIQGDSLQILHPAEQMKEFTSNTLITKTSNPRNLFTIYLHFL